LSPFIGAVGVAPRFGRVETSLAPGEYGETWTVSKHHKESPSTSQCSWMAATWHFGDVHAAQGDGEICGVALETTGKVRLCFDIAKGKAIEWPRIENEEWIMVAGSSRPLMEAFKIAHIELLDGWSKTMDSAIGKTPSTLAGKGDAALDVVDPYYTVVAKFPKKLLR